jgi:2-iminobutanoate/2-iminopropanoate deaminase
MAIDKISPAHAPTPRGPYSPAVRAGDFIYVSGQGPIDPATDKISPGDIAHQTNIVLSNIRRILEAGGATMQDVVKCSVFLKHGAEFKEMNHVYSEFFGEHRPARTTVVCDFVNDMRVEIDCVAYKPVR